MLASLPYLTKPFPMARPINARPTYKAAPDPEN